MQPGFIYPASNNLSQRVKPQERTVFYLSESTGITVETLGHSLLTQFDGIEWQKINVPFLDTVEQAHTVLKQINHAIQTDPQRPLIFSTLLDQEILAIIKQADCRIFDFFETFIPALEAELHQPFAGSVGRAHGQHQLSYFRRISAINYVLTNDDGMNLKNFQEADIILIGVSRSGKTPTCIYLGLQYGIMAANYPLTPEDMDSFDLPKILKPVQQKLFGLTVQPARLHAIRQERRPNSDYASLVQCQKEIAWQESLFRRFNISFVDTTHISIEEISTIALNSCGLKRQLYG